MKTIGYLIFAAMFYIFRLFCPIRKKKVFCVMTHDCSKDGNVGLVVEYLRDKQEGYRFQYLNKSERDRARDIRKANRKWSFFIEKPYHLATSEFVLMDNVFLPMAYMRFSKKVSIIQLWHGTGTIKKFGQDVNTGNLKRLERKANSRITHLIVNSEYTKKQYGKAFGVAEDKVYVYGLPRTDLFFDSEKCEDRRRSFYQQYPSFLGKKLVLYVPTFRDQERDKPKLALDLKLWTERMKADYILMLRLHPFVAKAFEKEYDQQLEALKAQGIYSMSSYPDVSTLLLVADYVITDYSSVIFEYCLMKRPMIFYAYDLEEFSENGRGFYEVYEDFVPGPIVEDTDSLIRSIRQEQFDLDRIERFAKENYRYFDGKSAERLYFNIFHK